MKKIKQDKRQKSREILNLNKELPFFIHAKIFGDTFIALVLSVGFSISLIGGVGLKNVIYSLQHNFEDISFIRYFIIIMIATTVALYTIIAWISILNKKKYIKITDGEIVYKSIFRIKIIHIRDVEYVDFEYTDNGVFKAKREGMLIKCENNASINNSNNLFVNYMEFPKEQIKNAINSILKFKR